MKEMRELKMTDQSFDEMTKAMDDCLRWLDSKGFVFSTSEVIAMAAAVRQSRKLAAIGNTIEEMLISVADQLRGLRDDISEKNSA